MQTFKVKSHHGWFNDSCNNGFMLDLNMEPNGDKVIKFICEKNHSDDHVFDLTNPADIKMLFMFTGTSPEDLYCPEDDESTISHAKYEQKRADIRKWIYSYPLKPGIKMIRERTCGCNMGYCGAIIGIELEKNVYNTIGELFALFSGSSNVPCYSQGLKSDEVPWYEHPDSVFLYLEKADKDHVYKVHQRGSCYNEAIEIKLPTSDEDSKYTVMSWGYGR